MRVERLEVRVQVLLAVLGVDELVESVAAVVVVVLVLDAQRVRVYERSPRQRQLAPSPVEVDRLAVQLQQVDALPPEVQHQVIAAALVERDRDGAAVGGGALGQVERELVVAVGDTLCPRRGVALGEDVAFLGEDRLGHGVPRFSIDGGWPAKATAPCPQRQAGRSCPAFVTRGTIGQAQPEVSRFHAQQ